MTAFQPELPELPAVRVCRDRFAVQSKNRRVERIGNADSQRLDKGFFQRPEPEKGFVRHGAFQHKPGFIRRKRAVQHAGPQRTDGFAVHPQDGIRDAARRQSTAVAEVKTDLRVRRKIGLSMRIPCDIG